MTERKRQSLTRADLQTSAGLELLELLQSISDDGRLTADEVGLLHNWLADHPSVDLPARAQLDAVVTEVLKDGVVSEEEYLLLHATVLRLLPIEYRTIADIRRREANQSAKVESQERRSEEKQKRALAADRDRPLDRLDFMVAGAGRTAERREACEAATDGERVWLRREPDNQHDRNAIEVTTDADEVMGYVPREIARELAPLLDSDVRQDFAIKKVIESHRGGVVPVVRGNVYRSDSEKGAVRPSETSPPSIPKVSEPSRPTAPAPHFADNTATVTRAAELHVGTAPPTAKYPRWLIVFLALLCFAAIIGVVRFLGSR